MEKVTVDFNMDFDHILDLIYYKHLTDEIRKKEGDMSYYVKNGTIDNQTLRKLLDAKEDKVRLYSVTLSLYNDAAESGSGRGSFTSTTPRVLCTDNFFSKNLASSEEKFDEFYAKLRQEHILRTLKLQKNRAEKSGECILNFATFNLNYEGNLGFLNIGYGVGWAATAVGDNLKISLKKNDYSTEKIVYSMEKQAICLMVPKYMCRGVDYMPIDMRQK